MSLDSPLRSSPSGDPMGEGFTLRDQGLPHPLWGSRSPLSEGLTFPPAGRGGSAWLPPRGPPFCRGLLPASGHFCKLSPARFPHPRLRPCTVISAPHTLPPCSPQRWGTRFQRLTFTLLIYVSYHFPSQKASHGTSSFLSGVPVTLTEAPLPQCRASDTL